MTDRVILTIDMKGFEGEGLSDEDWEKVINDAVAVMLRSLGSYDSFAVSKQWVSDPEEGKKE